MKIEYRVDRRTKCWIPRNKPNKHGYVKVKVNGRTMYAHRLMLAIRLGVLGREEAHHVCGNTRCINPDHLEPRKTGEHQSYHRNCKPYEGEF